MLTGFVNQQLSDMPVMWIMCLGIKGTDPFKLSVKLLLFSLACSFLIYKMTNSLWLSSVLILCFSSGMMILITYMTSMNPREKVPIHRNTAVFRWIPLLFFTIWTLEKTFTSVSSKWTMKAFNFSSHVLFMIVILISLMLLSMVVSFNPMKPLKSFV